MKNVICLLITSLGLGTAAYADNNWEIDSKHSSAQFTVKHMMVSTVPGQIGGISGTITYDGKNVDGIKVNAKMDPATINTNEPGRDEHLRGADFFDVAKYPAMSFESTGIIPVMKGGFKMSGKLTMHGVTKPVELTVDGPTEPLKDTKKGVERIGAIASTTVNRKEWGLTYNSPLDNGGVAVSDDVKITLNLEAHRKLDEKASK